MGSELTLFLGDPKCQFGPPVSVGASGGEVLPQIHFIVCPVCPLAHPVVISLALECIIEIDILNNWKIPMLVP